MSQSIDPGMRVRLTSKARVQTDKVTGKPALLYPEGVLLLNPTGAAIVELCDGRCTVGEMMRQLALRYGSTPDGLSQDVTAYLGRLHERGLIEIVSGREDSP